MIKIVKNTPLLSKESLVETHFFNATIATVKEAHFLSFSTMIFEGVIPEIHACLKIFYKGPTERDFIFKTESMHFLVEDGTAVVSPLTINQTSADVKTASSCL